MKFGKPSGFATSLLAAAIFLAAYSQPASSATVNFVSGTVAGDVENVKVGGNFYNVDFVGNISSTDWTSMLDFTTLADATAAATALAAALTDAGATSVSLEEPGGAINDSVIFVSTPYDDDGTDLLGVAVFGASPGAWITTATSFTLGTSQFPFAADWTLVGPVSAVPVPAAFPLLAGGLGLMGFVGWRRKRKVAAAAI